MTGKTVKTARVMPLAQLEGRGRPCNLPIASFRPFQPSETQRNFQSLSNMGTVHTRDYSTKVSRWVKVNINSLPPDGPGKCFQSKPHLGRVLLRKISRLNPLGNSRCLYYVRRLLRNSFSEGQFYSLFHPQSSSLIRV